LGYRRLRELGGPPLRRVLSVGGGAANPVWTRLRTKALGVPVAAVPGREAAFGTALLALRALR
ncbi:MAG: carbohydrate kinase, partial [Acetobacteraceae bacterium]|nr:carbohydrate kinase [Acetobacteraceae bacterium]